jgi:hypothetical protein
MMFTAEGRLTTGQEQGEEVAEGMKRKDLNCTAK